MGILLVYKCHMEWAYMGMQMGVKLGLHRGTGTIHIGHTHLHVGLQAGTRKYPHGCRCVGAGLQSGGAGFVTPPPHPLLRGS